MPLQSTCPTQVRQLERISAMPLPGRVEWFYIKVSTPRGGVPLHKCCASASLESPPLFCHPRSPNWTRDLVTRHDDAPIIRRWSLCWRANRLFIVLVHNQWTAYSSERSRCQVFKSPLIFQLISCKILHGLLLIRGPPGCLFLRLMALCIL